MIAARWPLQSTTRPVRQRTSPLRSRSADERTTARRSAAVGRSADEERGVASAFALNQHLLDPGDGLARVQSPWAGARAVENRVTPIEPERVFEVVEPFPRRLIAAVHQPAPRLQQDGRTEESIRVPPCLLYTSDAAD